MGSRVKAAWEAQLAKLEAYRRRHDDCNVPVGWGEDPGLSRWVKDQRPAKNRPHWGSQSRACSKTALLEIGGQNRKFSTTVQGRRLPGMVSRAHKPANPNNGGD